MSDDDEKRVAAGRARSNSPYWVESLALGLDVLRAFGSSNSSMSIVELAQALKRNRTACYRFVHTLTELGYLQRDPETKRYRLGIRVLELGFACLHQLPLASLAQPYLDRLKQETGASANVALLDGDCITFIARAPGASASAITLHIGSRLPAISTSIGRVLLAFRPPQEVDDLLQRSPPVKYTNQTLATSAEIQKGLSKIQAQGYAYVDEEFEVGIRSVAAPIFDRRGDAVAGVNVVWNASAISKSAITSSVIPAVVKAGRELSACLGYEDARSSARKGSA